MLQTKKICNFLIFCQIFMIVLPKCRALYVLLEKRAWQWEKGAWHYRKGAWRHAMLKVARRNTKNRSIFSCTCTCVFGKKLLLFDQPKLICFTSILGKKLLLFSNYLTNQSLSFCYYFAPLLQNLKNLLN